MPEKRTAAGVLAAIVTAVGGAYFLTADPSIGHSSALNAVFDSRLLVGLARLLVLATIMYLLASMVVRVQRGQWARGAGAVETDAPTQSLADDQEDLQQQLEDAQATISDLSERLARSLELIDSLSKMKKSGAEPGVGTLDKGEE